MMFIICANLAWLSLISGEFNQFLALGGLNLKMESVFFFLSRFSDTRG